MTLAAPPATRLLSAGFGIVMVAAAGAHTDGLAVVVSALSLIAVAAGIQFRSAATLAVLLTVAVIALTDPSAVSAALSGIAAAAYLVLRHATGSAAAAATPPAVTGAVLITCAALAATTLPARLAWAPLGTPAIVLSIYLLTVHPLAGDALPNSG